MIINNKLIPTKIIYLRCNFQQNIELSQFAEFKLLEIGVKFIKNGRYKTKVRTLNYMIPQIRIQLIGIKRPLENYVSEHSNRYLEDLANGRAPQLINGKQNLFKFSSFYRIGPIPDSLPDPLDKFQIRGFFIK